MPPSQKKVPNWILNYILIKPHVNCKNSTNLSALRNVRIKGSFSAQLVCKSVIWTFFFLKWRHKVSEIHKCGAWSKSLHGDVFTTYWGKIESFLPKSTERVWDVEFRQWGEWERSLEELSALVSSQRTIPQVACRSSRSLSWQPSSPFSPHFLLCYLRETV